MRDMVLYDTERLKKLYKEDLQVSKSGRLLLRKNREFFEVSNANFELPGGRAKSSRSRDKSGKQGKKVIQVTFNFPRCHLLRDPKKNWFEIATETLDNVDFYKLLGEGCPLDLTGVITGTLGNRKMFQDIPGEFYMEEEPESSAINYALFMINSSSQDIFINDARALMTLLSEDTESYDVCDPLGNKVMLSTSPTEQFVLVPVLLLDGGKAAITAVWNTIYKKKRR